MEDKSNNARSFGFSKIEWEIKNYFAATSMDKWVIGSPTFTIHGRSITKWRLFLKENYINGRHSVFAHLVKMEDEASKEPIWVSWRAFFPWYEDSMALEIEYDFEKKKSVEIEISGVAELENIVKYNNEDTLIIRNVIFVSSKDSQVHERPKDLGLKSLSQDLRVLYRVDKNYDLNLLIGGFPVGAHKGILYCRNAVLKKVIQRDDFLNKLPDVDVDAAENVLGYLYTGNLDYVLRKPSLLMLHCIKYFGIKELEEYYESDQIELRSEFKKRECILDYIISLEKIAESDIIISSPSIRKDSSAFEQILSLHIHMKDVSEENDDVSVSIESIKENFPKNSYVELYVINSCGDIEYLRRERCPDSTSRICFEHLFPRDLLTDATFTSDGNLHVLCKFNTVVVGSRILSTIRKKLHSDIRVDPEKHYQILSDQMVTLFGSGIHSDFTLTCDGEKFRVHSYILSARSHVFQQLFTKTKTFSNTNIIDISSMSSNVLRAVLYYIYSGKLLNYEINEILQIYEAAERFYLLSLKYKCSNILENNIESLDIESIMRLALQFKDYKLISSLKKFS